MATKPTGCEHLEMFIENENGLKTFQLLHDVFVISVSVEQRHSKLLNAWCFECLRKDLYLRVCMHCNYFGCGSHIKTHIEKTEHVFTMEVQYGQLYCSVCSDFIFDYRLDKIARVNAVSGGVIKRHILELIWPCLYKSETDLVDDTQRFVFNNGTRFGLRGLLNLGSTCYMNSVVQAMTHTPILRDYFFTDQHKCQVTPGPCLITKLFRDFYTGERSPLVLNDLLYLLWIRVRYLSGYKQQDAHEFFMAALEIFHKHCAKTSQIQPLSIINKVYKCGCIIDKAFASTMQADVVCQKCSGVSTRIDPMWAYSLDLTPSVIDGSLPKSLEDCIRHFTATEILDQKIFCEVCQSNQQSTKQDRIKTLPIVLCFHLKRFQQSKDVKKKVTIKINFPEILRMTPFLSKDKYDNKNSDINFSNENRYLLFAVIIHKGDALDAGHYISYIRYGGSVWYRCDDTNISEVLIEEVLQSEGYLLFYHRQRMEYR